MKHRIRWENKNFGDIGTLTSNDLHIVVHIEFILILFVSNPESQLKQIDIEVFTVTK